MERWGGAVVAVRARCSDAEGRTEPGEPKVAEERPPRPVEQQVRRLEVAVQHACEIAGR